MQIPYGYLVDGNAVPCSEESLGACSVSPVCLVGALVSLPGHRFVCFGPPASSEESRETKPMSSKTSLHTSYRLLGFTCNLLIYESSLL